MDGFEVDRQPYSPFDIICLAASTDLKSIRVDFALATTASRRRREPFSTEIVIEIKGSLKNGEQSRVRQEIVHPAGQAPQTALGVALGVEPLLGLDGGEVVPPGLYLPEVLIDPATSCGG